MNKQELIEKLKRHLTVMSGVEGSEYDKGYKYATKQHLVMITELDEQEKPTVPQYVADFYEDIKDSFEWSLYNLCIDFHKRELQDDLFDWFKYNDTKPIETLVKMKLYGYEVEKEKLYTVEIPNPNLNAHTILQKTGEGIVLVTVGNARWKGWESSKLTEAEIKQDFDFLWQFAKEVEE